MPDYLVSLLITDTAVSLTAENPAAVDFLADLTSEHKDFRRFINNTLVLSQDEGSFLCDLISANSFTWKRCHFRGFPGSDLIQPPTYNQKRLILSLLPDHVTSQHQIKIWARNLRQQRLH